MEGGPPAPHLLSIESPDSSAGAFFDWCFALHEATPARRLVTPLARRDRAGTTVQSPNNCHQMIFSAPRNFEPAIRVEGK
jgi:hypothetical protein